MEKNFFNSKKYKERKASDFWNGIRNCRPYFKKFEGKSREDGIEYIYNEGVRTGVKGTARALSEILSKELGKLHNVNNALKGKNASYKYLEEIQDACENLQTIDKKGFKKGIKACEKLQEALEKASNFSDILKVSFLSEKNVKEYMKTQSETLKASITEMKKYVNRVEIKEIKETKNPIKNIYTKQKTAQFLKAVDNVSFKTLKKSGLNAENISATYSKYFENSKVIAEKLEKIISDELKKEIHNKKSKENKNTSKKYLLKIQNACSNLVKVVNTSQREKDGTFAREIAALGGLKDAFEAASKFSDPHKISFLSNKDVRKYMIDQYAILNKSITNMRTLLSKLSK